MEPTTTRELMKLAYDVLGILAIAIGGWFGMNGQMEVGAILLMAGTGFLGLKRYQNIKAHAAADDNEENLDEVPDPPMAG